jgi:hypothetical protein
MDPVENFVTQLQRAGARLIAPFVIAILMTNFTLAFFPLGELSPWGTYRMNDTQFFIALVIICCWWYPAHFLVKAVYDAKDKADKL